MPAKPFDIQEYIKSLKLSPEDEKAVAPILGKAEVIEEVKRGWNSQSESSRIVDEANALKTASAAEKAEAERLKAETVALDKKNKDWADALKKYEGDVQATQAEKDALAVKNAAYEKYLQNIGVEPSYALEGVELPKPVPRQEPPVPNPKAPVLDDETLAKMGYIKREEVGRVGQLLADLPFEVTVLNQKHMELYGKPIPASELQALKGDYLNPQNTRSLTDLAREKLHFEDREKELSEQAINERIEKAADEKFIKRMSEIQISGATIDSIAGQGAGLDSSSIHFASKAFSENAKGSQPGDASQISEEEMQLFLQADQELAAKGIRPTPF